MNVLGSFFLGDAHHMRLKSSSTSPPISPTPSISFNGAHSQQNPGGFRFGIDPNIPPELSLELRVRWLEALVNGIKDNRRGRNAQNRDAGEEGADESEERRARINPEGIGERGETIARKLEEIQTRLGSIVEQNETMKLFLKHYDSSNARYLTPSFALNDPDQPNPAEPPTIAMMSPSEFEVYLKDMEPEIRQAERDLREIDALEKRGVSAAGNLGAHEDLQPCLEALLASHLQNARKAADLETRIISVMDKYTYKTDALSELFVEWHSVLLGVEEKVRSLEKEKAEKAKLGYS